MTPRELMAMGARSFLLASPPQRDYSAFQYSAREGYTPMELAPSAYEYSHAIVDRYLALAGSLVMMALASGTKAHAIGIDLLDALRYGSSGDRNIFTDVSPDLREQMLQAMRAMRKTHTVEFEIHRLLDRRVDVIGVKWTL